MLTHAYADLKTGVRLHYVAEGEGKLMLFLHGNPAFWYGWKRQLSFFRSRYHVVAPDLPGYNLSSKPEPVERYRLSVVADDIRIFVEFLGYQKCILVGHDLGAAIGWHIAAKYPDLLEKFISICNWPPDVYRRSLRRHPEEQKEPDYIEPIFQPGFPELLARDNYAALVKSELGELQGLKPGTFTEEDKHIYIEAWSQPEMLNCMVKYYRALFGEMRQAIKREPDEDLLPPIQVPTLLIYGEREAFGPGPIRSYTFDYLKELVPHVTTRAVADGSHVLIYDHADLVNSMILEFTEG
jgi:pimeloyl-ACP methyl ester carboxylesterase